MSVQKGMRKLFLLTNKTLLSEFPNTGVNKLRTSESVPITSYHVGTEPEQGNLYSPEQTSLHESEGLLYKF